MVKRKKTSLISVQGTPVTIIDLDQNDYISLTDMAKARTDSARAADVIKNWLSRYLIALIQKGVFRTEQRRTRRTPYTGAQGQAPSRALTPALAARVLRRNFWDVFPLDNVQPLCAMVIYDTAVNMGVFYARKMAQQALGLQVDGRWGPLTWAALKSCDDKKTAVAMCHIRRARYCELARSNPAFSPFLHGWLRRADALEETVEGA